jgi:hypothetical protein
MTENNSRMDGLLEWGHSFNLCIRGLFFLNPTECQVTPASRVFLKAGVELKEKKKCVLVDPPSAPLFVTYYLITNSIVFNLREHVVQEHYASSRHQGTLQG